MTAPDRDLDACQGTAWGCLPWRRWWRNRCERRAARRAAWRSFAAGNEQEHR